MADFLTKRERSARMATIKSSGTRPERLLLEAIHRAGLQPTTNTTGIPGKPDIVFRRARLACFVDGDLWHGGQWRRRGLSCLDDQFSEAENRDYWMRKVNSNISRDIRNTAALVLAGWSVVRFWASDVEKDPNGCAHRILGIRSGEERPDRFSYASTATVADFFAGIGLMRLGLERSGWQTIWANDYDATKRKLYQHNLGGHPLITSKSDIPCYYLP
jgi:DNA mismatch endonuclease, patch repair protein